MTNDLKILLPKDLIIKIELNLVTVKTNSKKFKKMIRCLHLPNHIRIDSTTTRLYLCIFYQMISI